MAHLSLALAPIQTPMERIFEKVMLRKMTEEEKEVLQLNVHSKPRKKLFSNQASFSHKKAPRLPEKMQQN
jgi:hypothetical protein